MTFSVVVTVVDNVVDVARNVVLDVVNFNRKKGKDSELVKGGWPTNILGSFTKNLSM